jgi:hypothetical protein
MADDLYRHLMDSAQSGTDRIDAGAEAEHILARLRPHFADQRAATIKRMIAHHNSESLTDDNMRSLIATLAALDALEKDLSHRVKLGQKDLHDRGMLTRG